MTDVSIKPAAKSSGGLDHLIYVLRANPVTMLAFCMFALIILAAVYLQQGRRGKNA